MFYAVNVLQKKGPLGPVWIAAHHDVGKKLTKLQILNTDIAATAGQIEHPTEEMALRLSSHLLMGLSRIYTRKVQFLFTDCNEALSKITLAFRPSTVDLGPVSKAQVRAITMDQPVGVSALDLDLSLDLDPSEWLASGVNQSQASAADITLPDMAGGASQSRWEEEEDPLLFGSAPDGDNPLDVDYGGEGMEAPEAMRDEDGGAEEPEVRRDSDSQAYRPADEMEMEPFEAPQMPDFDAEDMPQARPSGAHSMPGDVLSTPLHRSGDESGMLDFDTPVIELKKGRQAGKKKRTHALDESTEISKAVMRQWIMEPGAVQDLMREPRPLPKTADEASKRRKEELLRKGKLAEVQVKEPLSGLMGPVLREVLASVGNKGRPLQSNSARKRKAREEPAALDRDVSREEEGGVPQDDSLWEQSEMPEMPDFEPQQDDGEGYGAMGGEGGGEIMPAEGVEANSIFGEYAREDDEREEEEEEEGLHGKVTEQAERTKKVIVLLQKSFTKGANSGAAEPKPLKFFSMIKGSGAQAEEKPSKHTAAVAFFELLGLQAKGMVQLQQPEPYGDISIGQTQLLMRQKV